MPRNSTLDGSCKLTKKSETMVIASEKTIGMKTKLKRRKAIVALLITHKCDSK